MIANVFNDLEKFKGHIHASIWASPLDPCESVALKLYFRSTRTSQYEQPPTRGWPQTISSIVLPLTWCFGLGRARGSSSTAMTFLSFRSHQTYTLTLVFSTAPYSEMFPATLSCIIGFHPIIPLGGFRLVSPVCSCAGLAGGGQRI